MVSCIPQISIVVPVYNVEKYLRRCIDSILAQTFTDFELLLIDDGSKDSSGSICDEYAKKDNRIRVFHKENGGVSSARNVGLDNAQGDWICFCDADDWVKSEFLSTFRNMMKDGDLLSQGFHSFNWQNNGDKDIFEATGIYQRDDLLKFLLQLHEKNQLGFIWCKSFKRKIINENHLKFDKDIHFMEDLMFVLQYCTYIKSINNNALCLYQYKFTDSGKVFSPQDDFVVLKRIYLLFKVLDKGMTYNENIKILFMDDIINNLICGKFSNSMLYDNIKFVANEFGECLYQSKGKYKKVKLFKMLFSQKYLVYDYFLTTFFRIFYA